VKTLSYILIVVPVMPYFMCEKCRKEYELEPGEQPSDYQCECGGSLRLTDNIDEKTDSTITPFYCAYCGAENEDKTTFCKDCGKRIKPEEKKSGITSLINWKAIILGGFAFFVLFVSLLVLFFIIQNEYIFIASLVAVPLLSGILTGYISGNEYSGGILNSAILGMLLSIIFGLIMGGIVGILAFLLVFLIFGVIGGAIGVYYRKKRDQHISEDDSYYVKNENLVYAKWMFLIFPGTVMILGCLGSFWYSKSYVDIYYGTLGIMAIIMGFSIEDYRIIIVPFTYFVVLVCVNIFQWFILIYILLIGQVDVTNKPFFLIPALVTTTLLFQIVSRKQIIR